MAIPTWQEIEAMTPAELAKHFDSGVEHVLPGVQFWADLLVYKASMEVAHAQSEQNRRMVHLTASIEDLTNRLWWLAALSVGASITAIIVAMT